MYVSIFFRIIYVFIITVLKDFDATKKSVLCFRKITLTASLINSNLDFTHTTLFISSKSLRYLINIIHTAIVLKLNFVLTALSNRIFTAR